VPADRLAPPKYGPAQFRAKTCRVFLPRRSSDGTAHQTESIISSRNGSSPVARPTTKSACGAKIEFTNRCSPRPWEPLRPRAWRTPDSDIRRGVELYASKPQLFRPPGCSITPSAPTSSGGSHRVGLPPAPRHGEALATAGDDNECPSSVRARRKRLSCQMTLGLVHFSAVEFNAAGRSIREPCWALGFPQISRPVRETRGGLERLGVANLAHRVLLDAVRLIPRARIRCSRSG
jgi:hypothetical protein